METPSRVLIYAKATDDVRTCRWLADLVMIRFMVGAATCVRANAPYISAACAFFESKLTYYDSVTRLYKHQRLPYNPLLLEPINEGSTLADFLDAAKVKPFPHPELGKEEALVHFLNTQTEGQLPLGEKDVLLIWGHGSASAALHQPLDALAGVRGRGLAGLRAETRAEVNTLFANDDHLQPAEIANALKKGDHKPGLILFSTCQGGTVELLEALQGSAHYLISSPGTVYPTDWEYEKWLPAVFTSLPFDPLDAGKKFIALSKAITNETTPFVALSDLTQVSLLKGAVAAFVSASEKLPEAERIAVATLIGANNSFYTSDSRLVTVDLAHIAQEISKKGLIVQECQAVIAAIKAVNIDKDDSRVPPTFGGTSIVYPKLGVTPVRGGAYLNEVDMIGDKVFDSFVYKTGWRKFIKITAGSKGLLGQQLEMELKQGGQLR
jgi:hypothetical protein